MKSLEHVTDLEGLLDYTVVPNFRTLGPKAGPRMPAVKQALESADAHQIRTALDEHGAYDLTLDDGSTVALTADDVDVRAASHEELALARDGADAVALDTTIDDELHAEGIARDLVRVINDQRKALDFEIADRIRVRIGATGIVFAATHSHRDWIAGEVLAVEISVEGALEIPNAVLVEVDGEAVALLLARV